MSETLVQYYGVEFQYEKNRLVTDAWDKTQERVRLKLFQRFSQEIVHFYSDYFSLFFSHLSFDFYII